MEELIKLRDILDQKFSLTEIQALCAELEMDYDTLGAGSLSEKIISLLARLKHLDEVGKLVSLIAKYRPDIDLSFFSGNITDLTSRHRPAGPGSSISNGRGGMATFGCLVASRHNPEDLYILCDGSGMFAGGLNDGDMIVQPAMADNGNLETDLIGLVSDFVLPSAGGSSGAFNLSAAIASVTDPKAVSPQLPDGNFLQDDAEPHVGQSVKGFGRSSGEVRGEILSIDASVTIPWVFQNGDQEQVEFQGLVETTPMMAAGDSGIVIFDDAFRPVGLGFAASQTSSLFFPIDRVLDYFEIDIVTESFWRHYRT